MKKNHTYKYILFDWDGCLAKTLDVWLDSYKQVLQELHINKTDREITEVFGDWQGGIRLGAPDNEVFFDRVDELVAAKMPQVDLYEGVAEVITTLKEQGMRLAVLSSSLRDYIIPAMQFHQIQDKFDVILTGEDVTKHKPDPEVIHLGIRSLNANKVECVMIGDSDNDVLAAKNAGIDSILFYPKAHQLFYSLEKLMLARPTFQANSFEEIAQITSVVSH